MKMIKEDLLEINIIYSIKRKKATINIFGAEFVKSKN